MSIIVGDDKVNLDNKKFCNNFKNTYYASNDCKEIILRTTILVVSNFILDTEYKRRNDSAPRSMIRLIKIRFHTVVLHWVWVILI